MCWFRVGGVRLGTLEASGVLLFCARTLDATAKVPDTLGSLEGNTKGPGTASSEPLLPS